MPSIAGADDNPVVPSTAGADDNPVVPSTAGADDNPVVPSTAGADDNPVQEDGNTRFVTCCPHRKETLLVGHTRERCQ